MPVPPVRRISNGGSRKIEGPKDPFSEGSELRRELGLFDSTMVVSGLVIGSGIFLTTGTIALDLPQGGWILAVWMVGGLLSLAGALTFAELGALMPRAGGQYVFLREAYGDPIGFLFGWAYLLVIQSGSIAAVAVGFAEYFNYFVAGIPRTATAVCVILLLSWINYRGVRESSILQNLFTTLKVAVILGIALLGIYLLHFGRAAGTSPAEFSFTALPPVSAFGVAMIAVLWTFDGWNCITFNAGEIKNPRRNLPLALVIGTLLVTFCYVLLNYVYVAALPMDQLQGVVRVAELTVSTLFGPATTYLVVLAVLISTFGSINAMILTAPRIYYAMSRDGLFFAALGKIHPERGTPGAAVWTQGLWALALAVSGTYDQLFTLVIFSSMGFYAASGFAVFVFRWKYPEAKRPYRTWGYPVTPLLYVGVMLFILVNTLLERPWESLWGCLLVGSGLPAYWYWKKQAAGRRDRDA